MYTINLTIVQDHNNDKEPGEIHRQIAKYKITNNKHNNRLPLSPGFSPVLVEVILHVAISLRVSMSS